MIGNSSQQNQRIMGAAWKQRKTGMLSLPKKVRNIPADSANYLHPVVLEGSDEIRYYFKNEDNSSLVYTPAEYSFEEAFWLVPDFFKFVTYKYDPETRKATINDHDTGANPEKIEHVFEKVFLNLARKNAPSTLLSPSSIHPCKGEADGLAGSTSNNCMAPLRTEDGNFILMYAKDTSKKYITDVSSSYAMRLNNYFIPLLSADMSIWWYKVPSFIPRGTSADRAQWGNDALSRQNAEKILSIWHQDQEAFSAALDQHPDLEEKFYIGVYQRSFFCDELQMRFTNLARIGNDGNVDVSFNIEEFDTVTYDVLSTDFAAFMLGM
jgi:hypothetical protein